MDNNEKETFNYTYFTRQQEEIKAIRKKHAPPEGNEDKMAELRRLDEGVTQKATIVSLIVGIIGTLMLGFGMSLIMSDFCEILGLRQELVMAIKVPTGVIVSTFSSLLYRKELMDIPLTDYAK